MKDPNVLIADEVAIPLLRDYINKHLVGVQLQDEDIPENYAATLQAVREGRLIFDNGEPPVLALKEPLESDEGNVILEKVEFKTRIRPNELANLSKGINLSKDSFQYALRCTAFIIGQPQSYLNKLGKFDYTVIQQLSAVFM